MIWTPNDRHRLTNQKAIRSYIHCGKCEESCPSTMSVKDWSQFEIGFTSDGIQIWCRRHNCNVAHFDLKGARVNVEAGVAKMRDH